MSFLLKLKGVFFTIILMSTISNSYAGPDRGLSEHSGGLMRQMMNKKYFIAPIVDVRAKNRLNAIDLKDTQDGGLMRSIMNEKHFIHLNIQPNAQERLHKIILQDSNK
nr:hypothetical protein [uncultured Tolumonas sp.]